MYVLFKQKHSPYNDLKTDIRISKVAEYSKLTQLD